MTTSRQRWAVAGLVGAVVVLRVVLVLAVHAGHPDRAITDDTDGYTGPARALVHDREFDREPGSSAPEFQRTPGYPAFVGAIYWITGDDEPGGTGDAVVVGAQAALSGISVLLAMLVAWRLSRSPAVALAVGAMVGLDPLQTSQSGLIVSETLATVLTTLAVYCGVRFLGTGADRFSVRWAAACGLSLVAATYVRPTTYYFPMLVVLALAGAALWQRRRNRAVEAVEAAGPDAADGPEVAVAASGPEPRRTVLRAAVAFGLPCLVLLGAWDLRNHQRVDSWKFSGLEGTNLYWYRAAAVEAARTGDGLEPTQVRLTEELSRGRVEPFDYEAWRSGEPPPPWQHRQGEYYARAQTAAVDILRDEPVRAAREYARAVYGQVVQSGWRTAFEYVLGESPPAVLQAPGLVVVWGVELLAVVGAVVALRRTGPARWAHLLVVGLALYVILVTAAGPDAGGGYRFRIPIWPIWCLYAGLGLQAIHGRLGERLPARLRPRRGVVGADTGSFVGGDAGSRDDLETASSRATRA